MENKTFICYINLTTKLSEGELNVSSTAFLRNYNPSYDVENESWFYGLNQTNSSNFVKTIKVNVTPQKTEIGNWTINFTARDTTYSQIISELIYVSVNRTFNDAPDLIDISNLTKLQIS